MTTDGPWWSCGLLCYFLFSVRFWNNHDYVECLVRPVQPWISDLMLAGCRTRAPAGRCRRPFWIGSPCREADLPDSRGRTALHVAARKGLSELVPLILGARGNPDARDGDGWTALHHAVFNGHTETVRPTVGGAACRRVR